MGNLGRIRGKVIDKRFKVGIKRSVKITEAIVNSRKNGRSGDG